MAEGYTVMLKPDQVPAGPVYLGQGGENRARSVVFDFGPWEAAYGAGTISLLFRAPGEEEACPVTVAVRGSAAHWLPEACHTAAGRGEMQWVYTVDGVVAKTRVYPTLCGGSLAPGETPPAGWQSWVDSVLAAADRAEAASAHGPVIRDGIWWVWSPEEGDYVSTGVVARGGTFIHLQTRAAAAWTIVHGMGRFPSVSVTDSAGSLVAGEVSYPDENTVEVTFRGAFSGKAYLN